MIIVGVTVETKLQVLCIRHVFMVLRFLLLPQNCIIFHLQFLGEFVILQENYSFHLLITDHHHLK